MVRKILILKSSFIINACKGFTGDNINVTKEQAIDSTRFSEQKKINILMENFNPLQFILFSQILHYFFVFFNCVCGPWSRAQTFDLHNYTKNPSFAQLPSFQHSPICIPANQLLLEQTSKCESLQNKHEHQQSTTDQLAHSFSKYNFKLSLLVWPRYL